MLFICSPFKSFPVVINAQLCSHIAFQINELFVYGWMEKGGFSQRAAVDVNAFLEDSLTITGFG